MSADNSVNAAFYALALLLPLSALAARRVAWRRGLALAAAWIGIFGTALLVFAERDRVAAVLRDVRHALDPEAGVQHGAELHVPIAADGHFWVRAEVNGRPLRFLIDSGASTTMLGADAARAADVAADTGFGGNFGIPVETANGTVIAHRATIQRLRVGTAIDRHDVRAMIAPEFGDTNVLGMSFLSSLRRWSVEDGTLVLVP